MTKSASKPLSANMEDYLEAISHIIAEKQAAKAKDIAQMLNVRYSSVTGALRALSGKGYINYAPYDLITMTTKGKKLAEDIVRRHEALLDFFVSILCVDRAEAERAACEMEHAVSRNILDRLIRFTEFVDVCPRGGKNWLNEFWKHCDRGRLYEDCENCLTLCMKDFNKQKKQHTAAKRRPVMLNELKKGQKGKIMKVTARSRIAKKLSSMGIARGSIIKVEGIHSDNNSLDIKVKGYHLTIRDDDAEKITVDVHK